MKIGLYRCSFDSGGTSYPAVLVFNTADPVSLLVGERMFSKIDLPKAYPGATELGSLGPAVMAPVPVGPYGWRALTEAEKATLMRARRTRGAIVTAIT